MFKIIRAAFLSLFLIGASMLPSTVHAETTGTQNVQKAEALVDQAIHSTQQGDLAKAKNWYEQYRDQWLDFEGTVKSDSGKAYSDIESNMGQVDYALLQNKQGDVLKALQALQNTNTQYIQGKYANGAQFKQENITLADFVAMLQKTNEAVKQHDQQSAEKQIASVRESWLSVEGTVVAQSATVYNDSERDMVTVKAMIEAGDSTGASNLLGKMVNYLQPLTGKSAYTIWDAAMIPIREGLEALLVVGALLAFVKKSNNGKGKGWIWGGVSAGFVLSAVIALLVKVVFSSGAFGQNNFLIGGWTGVIAAAMLLYMSYWLHSKSNISEWNGFIKTKSSEAIGTGSLISLGLLSFLAVFREGTETVLFVIGMVNQISYQELILGILIGLGVLAVIAFLMLFVGVKLPMKPFFLVSSVIVFYLCLKFTGLGIRSFQLAGAIPSTTAAHLPTIDFVGFYPSWENAIPQFALLFIALVVLTVQRMKSKKNTASVGGNLS